MELLRADLIAPKVRTCHIGVECAAARSPGQQEGSYVAEVVLIENVERISPQLEFQALRDVNRFLQTNVKVAITRLPEVLDVWSFARIKVKLLAGSNEFTFNTG